MTCIRYVFEIIKAEEQQTAKCARHASAQTGCTSAELQELQSYFMRCMQVKIISDASLNPSNVIIVDDMCLPWAC